MNHRLFAIVALVCGSALAQAPPPLQPAPLAPSAAPLNPAHGSGPGEPATSEREVGGPPATGNMGAGPAPATDDSAAQAPVRPARMQLPSIPDGAPNGGPN